MNVEKTATEKEKRIENTDVKQGKHRTKYN